MDKDLKDIVELRNHKGIFILYLNTEENRFNSTSINKIHECLDEVEKYEGDTCLITVSTSKKIWSNGLDLDWMSSQGQEVFKQNIIDFIRLFGRFLIFPVPTIAMIQGHAFAGGCMLAMAHDYRYMMNGKGFICLPELDISMWLPFGMTDVCQCKLTPEAYTEMYYGKRFTSLEAEKYGVITKACDKRTIFDEVMMKAKTVMDRGNKKEILHKIKYITYYDAYERCRKGEIEVTVPPVQRAKI
uniref:Uncharacterized protein n=1 Tax=Euplotes crassus TaxID=5936 RepID=A0A7S3NYW3_EUPCR|mmetsp:Transcript_36133/g.35734  ORF Transcript_36133/g.35734 Transcript_36133/m.35734 type:complete len:243 (+) Transcript_36133:15-743(+)